MYMFNYVHTNIFRLQVRRETNIAMQVTGETARNKLALPGNQTFH